MADNSPFTTSDPMSSAPLSSTPSAPTSSPPTSSAPIASQSVMGANVSPSAAVEFPSPTGDAVTDTSAGEVIQLQDARDSGASWFYWIAALSLVNTVLFLFGSGIAFGLGLGATLLVDGIVGGVAKTAGSGGGVILRAVELGLDFVIIGAMAAFGFLAQKGKGWAFIIGGILLLLDTLLVVAFQMWISVAIHAWALFSIFSGWNASKKLAKLQAAQAAGPSPFSS